METPFPSLAQYWAMAGKVDGRVSVGLAEIKRRLELTMLKDAPYDLISYANTQLGYAGERAIRHPKFVASAPTGDDDGYMNGILLGASDDKEFQGNNQFKNLYTISIYSIDKRIETEEEYHRTKDRVGLIFTALYPFLGGCVDPLNRTAWRALEPQQSGTEVADWSEFSGEYLFYRMVVDPSQNLWTAGS